MATRYLDDEPISGLPDDALGRGEFAHRVADTITGRSDTRGLVVAIYGAWGEGKSSVLNLMAERIAATKGYVLLTFNPWFVETQEQLLRLFLHDLSAAIGRSTKTRQAISKALLRYSDAVGAVAGPVIGAFAGVSPSGEPHVDGKAVGDAVAGVGKALGRALGDQTLPELRDAVAAALDKAKLRIVVLMDDIDRLDAPEIMALVKLVKLTADFERVTFVLAFDDAVVAEAIAGRYPKALGDPGRGY